MTRYPTKTAPTITTITKKKTMLIAALSTVKYTVHIKYYIIANISIVLKDTNNEHNVLTCDYFLLCEHRMEKHLDDLLTNTTILSLCHI